MITISRLVFNPFQENTYIISAPNGDCIIIDAGNYSAKEDSALSGYIKEKGMRPIMALNTHGHVDHMLGVAYVKDTFGVPFALHSDDNFLIESCTTHGAIYGFDVKGIPVIETDLKNLKEIELGDSKLRIIHTPGHTPGHICLFDPETKSLFCGDTLFRESIGRTDLPGGDYSWIMKSILEQIVPLGEDVKIYPGHGPESTIGHEVLYNPFIAEVLQGDVNYK